MAKADQLWLGTDASLEAYLEVRPNLFRPLPEDEDLPADPEHFDLQGDVAVVRIAGPLVKEDSFWNALMGLTSYTFIRNAVIEAATDERVKSIVLDIDSGGGAASAVAEVGKVIQKVDREFKPVYAYTGGTMASAAYWLGASARQVFATETAMVGSIGVIATHLDRSKQLKDEGIEATIFRAGKFKALGHPYEPLTDQAKEIIQVEIDVLYDIFVDHVAARRKKTPKWVKDYMAEGREFLGQAAFEVGLTDGLKSIDDLMSELQARPGAVSTGSGYSTNGPAVGLDTNEEDTMAKRKVLAEKDVAAIAAGAPIEAVMDAAPAVEVTEEVAEPMVEAAAGTTLVPAGDSGSESVVSPAADSELVAFLKTELASARGDAVQAQVTVKELQAKLATFDACVPGLRDIAATAINRMKIATGGSAMDLSALPSENLLQEYAATVKTFNETFPVGGVSKVASVEEPKAPILTAPNAARLAAVRMGKK